MLQSEVDRIKRQIALEYEAGKRVFTEFTPTAKHEYITKRQENIGVYFEELSKLMPKEEAIALVSETLESLQSSGFVSGNTS